MLFLEGSVLAGLAGGREQVALKGAPGSTACLHGWLPFTISFDCTLLVGSLNSSRKSRLTASSGSMLHVFNFKRPLLHEAASLGC